MVSLLNEAKSLGFNIYQDSYNHYQWTIEIPLDKGELLMREQGFGKWLLISNTIPQVWLKTELGLKFLKKLNRK